MKRVLVVVPTYNEANNIARLIAALFEVFSVSPLYRLEVLVVDDNSPDGTGKIVKKLQKTNPSIHILRGTREGLGRAYVRGLLRALRLGKYFAVVTMDADFSHDPKAIPALLAQIEAGADCAIGSRYIDGGGVSATWPLRRVFQSHVANRIATELTGLRRVARDSTSGFKAIRGSALATLPLAHLPAKGYVFQVNLLYEMVRLQLKIVEVPIVFENRRDGESKVRLRDITEFIKVCFMLNPQGNIQRFVRFSVVGAIGTLVNITILVVLVRAAHVQPLIGGAVAIELSIIANFFMNNSFTFRAQWSERRLRLRYMLARYHMVALSGAVLSYLVFAYAFRSLHFGYVIADLLGIAVGLVSNFVLSMRVVWKEPAVEAS